MVQLNSIGISNVKEGDEKNLCVSIENMRLLRVLTIMVTNEEETLRMDALSSPPPNLQRLILTGKEVPREPSLINRMKRRFQSQKGDNTTLSTGRKR